MSFKVLKPRASARIQGRTISVSKFHVTLSKELREDWPDGCEYLQVLLDDSKKMIALKPFKRPNEFTLKLSLNKKTSARFFQAKILLKNDVPLGKSEMLFDKKNGMYVGRYPEKKAAAV